MNEPTKKVTPSALRRAEKLAVTGLPKELEDSARSLLEKSCCGSRAIWPDLQKGSFETDSALRNSFYSLAHAGMFAAQEDFLETIIGGGELSRDRELLFRCAMDSIGWQLIGKQLCFARRLYRGKSQPSLKECKLETVVDVARKLREERKDSMPLLCDLTSFAQVGDILLAEPGIGLTVIEVKSGKKNIELGEAVAFYRAKGCEKFKEILTTQEDSNSVKQFERMVRQANRMDFVTQVFGARRARDPDTNEEVVIPQPYVQIGEWWDQLGDAIVRSHERGWAIEVVDGSVFIGCYREARMRQCGHLVFSGWLDEFADGEHSPRVRLIDGMAIPLALPTFHLPLAHSEILDIMFGRLHVCIGISLPGLIEECAKHGIKSRGATRCEKRMIQENSGSPVFYKGRPLVLEFEGKSMILADGVFLRAIFHGQKPVSVIQAYLKSEQDMT